MQWTLDSLKDKPLGDFKDFKEDPKIELGLVDDDTVAKIAKTLYCSSEDITARRECSGFTARIKDRVIMLKDDDSRSLYFGYAFIVNSSGQGGDNFRNVIYERAQDAWEEVSDVIASNPTYQQFHIGYTSGGSIAYLIACRVLSSTALPFGRLETRALNYVKVVTVDELPIYTSDTLQDNVGRANHAILTTTSDQPSSPDYSQFGTIIPLPKYSLRKDIELRMERLALFMSHRNAVSRLQGMSDSSRKRFKNAVLHQLAIVDAISSDLVQVFAKRSFALYGRKQNEYATILGDYISRFLPHSSESEIWCKAKKTVPSKFDRNKFEIQCSVQPNENEDEFYALASYEALLTTFPGRKEACNKIKVSVPLRSSWSKCIQGIALQFDELSLISPHGDESSDNCHFFADMNTAEWEKNPRGFVVKPNSLDESLSLLYKHKPLLFFSLFAEHITFPETCTSVIKPIRLKGRSFEEASKGLRTAFKYFSNMSRDFVPPAKSKNHCDQLPELFRSHSSEKFNTKELVLSGHQFVADDAVVQEILRCTSSQHATIVDCTLAANHWIPNTCPDFCIHGKQENLLLCTNMIYCPTVPAYIGYIHRSMSIMRSSLTNLTIPELDNSRIAQYAMYRFKPNSYLDLSEMTVGIFFTKLPNVEMVRKNRNLRRVTRNQKLDESELWNNNL
ncbi:hypothetical protein PSACC_00940 [Paramicrosporidium saccamoebae]|uniref:Uncharacterized protein n=1 Tax=Paramicrosporidium saccamoebae TaxID=1246581 RepID=A0A2H9TNL9_9FUNG|nr:hypothetical protein PSACC_00940 [Paramicrosporidium saccamoebae]